MRIFTNVIKWKKHTPSCTTLYNKCLVITGNISATDEVLNGTFECPPELDQNTKDFLWMCAQTEQDPTLYFERSPMEFQDSWKQAM